MKIPAMICMTLLVGCALPAAPHFDKPGATQASFDADMKVCEYEAAKAFNLYGPDNAQLRILCMKAKGYTLN